MRWTIKPPYGLHIDPSHPLATGLIGCWSLAEGGGLISMNRGRARSGPATMTLVNAPTWGQGRYGPRITVASASSQYLTSTAAFSDFSGAQQFSMVGWGNRAAAQHWVFGRGQTASQETVVRIYSDNYVYFRINGTYGRLPALTGDFSVGWTFDGTQAATWAARNTHYLNGIQTSVTSSSGTPPSSLSSNSDPFTIGYSATLAQYSNGSFDMVMVWNRVLGSGAMLSISNDPWQIFETESSRRWFYAVTTTGYTLTAGEGSYALSGQAAPLLFDRVLTAAEGSYALSGQAAPLLFDRVLSATEGSYALSGQAAPLLFDRVLSAAEGSYALSGQAAALYLGFTLTASPGSYSLTGEAAPLLFDRILAAAEGSYALTGEAITFRLGYTMVASPGSYALTGEAVTFARTYILTTSAGSYALTGIAANLIVSTPGLFNFVDPDAGTVVIQV